MRFHCTRDGTSLRFAVPSSFSVASTNTSVVSLMAGSENVLQGNTAGIANISVAWNSKVSNLMPLTVTSSQVSVRATKLMTVWEAGTFSGAVGSSRALEVAVEFDDGTEFEDAVGGVQSNWLSAHQFLEVRCDPVQSPSVSW